ncbi:SDR family NAD(P)-dependent oxidoreductase [Caballeronia sp. J97]|uniref:SDR family NAD(P)-dependent oxidoreductase n=1 Tax=Caballeronia sp. J97 TaxID=2805429 RepID=UPI002AB04596|nr:SDR family NAD(P)-dependent oxidoreductase [Caballeronia sp. J97]
MSSSSSTPVLPSLPSFRLDGRTALVTGAGRGIGAAAAAALAQAGAAVTLAARSRDELQTVAAAIKERGGRATVLPLDVTDSAAVRERIAQSGPFDILVNSAGTNRPALLADTPDSDIDAVTALNLKSTLYVTREVARGMVAGRRGGSIITVSSQMGHVGGPRRTLYCATKHAMEGMAKALAWELGPQGIRVNTLCPTFIETAMTAGMFRDEGFREFVTSRIALGRVGQLSDIMGAVVFLASEASAMVTGSALMVDGGWTAA